MNGRMSSVIGFAFAAAVGASSSVAGDSFSMNGQSNNKSDNMMKPAGESHVVVHVSGSGVLELEDTSNPAHGATGNCSGSVLVAMGEPEGTGLCTYETVGGDIMIVRWTTGSLNEAGGNAGTWELVGGTGPWASASASGTYSDMPAEDGTTSTNMITGEVSFN